MRFTWQAFIFIKRETRSSESFASNSRCKSSEDNLAATLVAQGANEDPDSYILRVRRRSDLAWSRLSGMARETEIPRRQDLRGLRKDRVTLTRNYRTIGLSHENSERQVKLRVNCKRID